MRSKSGDGRVMITAEQALERARSPLAALVAERERSAGSRMRAYGLVGAPLGRSATWVRKVLGRAPDVTVGLHDALNIATLYARVCDRIDASAEQVEASNNTLREELHAALSGAAAPPSRPAGTPVAEAAAPRGAGRPTSPALVAPHVRSRAPASVDLSDLPLWRASQQEK
jgi:hypothetical protein